LVRMDWRCDVWRQIDRAFISTTLSKSIDSDLEVIYRSRAQNLP
jgi:hypothetical protein